MTIERQIIISLKDVKQVGIKCACGVTIFFDVSAEMMEPKAECPWCGAQLGEAVIALARLKEFYKFAESFRTKAVERRKVENQKAAAGVDGPQRVLLYVDTGESAD
jgi:hypothetical protein